MIPTGPFWMICYHGHQICRTGFKKTDYQGCREAALNFSRYLLLSVYAYSGSLFFIPQNTLNNFWLSTWQILAGLAVQLYTSSLPRRVRDLHPLERAHGAQTQKNSEMDHHLRAQALHSSIKITVPSSSFIQTILSAPESHRIMPLGPRALPPVGNHTLPWRFRFFYHNTLYIICKAKDINAFQSEIKK